ncbi:nicotinate (nicotinamide) nucleotide adenylyltransferase [Campylobacter curvus]|uniref:nicotinate (nicotinamide) nucleotide adenylyltransferase n=1 Tax=Campylobacter curvus TaxID=200 RepID=UPI00147002E0|nr:nicotinate (nicotinamide) nucleotide adenylyltransferase [Campylobacter curvus]
MNLALFGGSFDPPHLGHDSIVKMALDSLDIDKLIIMPTYISPFKSEFSAPPELRLKWIRQIWGHLQKVEISDYEIALTRPVPTIETVEHLYEIYDIDSLYLIIGADHLATLNKWHDFRRLCSLVKFVIAERNHILIPENLQKMDVNVNISSSQIRHSKGLDELPSSIKDEVIKFYQGKNMQEISMNERIENIVKILDEKKAEEIQVFDMSDRDYFVKFVIIATTMGERHAYSLSDDLKENLKPLGERFLAIESSPDWIVLDLGDMLIHLLSPQYRAKYNIEEFLSKLKAQA